MFTTHIDENGEFDMDGVRFHIDTTAGNNRRPSDEHAFTLVKTKAFLDLYAALAEKHRPKGLLELGIFQGGSFVLLDKMFKPKRMAAVEISPTPIAPLVDYVANHPHQHVHFGMSQDDEPALQNIVSEELDGQLDLVIDDASHSYERTRRSFEILFPLMSPNGVYIIEDWAWSHAARLQEPSHPRHSQPALTNLIFELVALQGSTNGVIRSLRIHKQMVVIRKGAAPIKNVWDGLALRGRDFPMI